MKISSKFDELIPGLARVPRRTDDLALDVGEHALVLGVGAGVGHPDRSLLPHRLPERSVVSTVSRAVILKNILLQPFPFSFYASRQSLSIVVYGLHYRGGDGAEGEMTHKVYSNQGYRTRNMRCTCLLRTLSRRRRQESDGASSCPALFVSRWLLCFAFFSVASIEDCSANGTNEEYSSMERVFNLTVAVVVARQRHANF